MDRSQFAHEFARRLSNVMKNEGHFSKRSNSGLNINLLSEISGCSYQMARRYLLGEALPEIYVILKISKWLRVAPGWLLFGDKDPLLSSPKSLNNIEIDLDLLKYILIKSDDLFSFTENKSSVINFIVDAVYDASHLNTDQETNKKIIDMMISSAEKLNTKEVFNGKKRHVSTK